MNLALVANNYRNGDKTLDNSIGCATIRLGKNFKFDPNLTGQEVIEMDDAMTLKELARLIRELKADGATEEDIYKYIESMADLPEGFILGGKDGEK